jgi:ubiquinone/menaquinone biosynthesis C-methylase UbiE
VSTLLNARDGYRLGAPSYAQETAISDLDTMLVDAMTPPLLGLRLLDAGCGTGRRLLGAGAAHAVGVDLSPEMLDAGIGRGNPGAGVTTMVGDVCALPLPDRSFDVVWCRLVIGHLRQCEPVYTELARVASAGATVIVTDFHATAYEAGHRRTFRDGQTVHEVEHYVHSQQEQVAAAAASGLRSIAIEEARIGPRVVPFYENAGRVALYHEHAGLPVVLALAFRRED